MIYSDGGVAGGFLFDKFADHGFMLIFFIVFIMGAGQALLTSAGYVWLLFVDVYIVGVMFGALHGGKGGNVFLGSARMRESLKARSRNQGTIFSSFPCKV